MLNHCFASRDDGNDPLDPFCEHKQSWVFQLINIRVKDA
jgi:hypothetical protein